MYIEVDDWCTTVCSVTQGPDQGHEPFKVGNPAIFNSYLLRHLQLELATDNWFLNQGTLPNFFGPDFLYSA